MKEIKIKEVIRFNHSTHMQQLILRVSKVLGLEDNLTLGMIV